MAYERTWQPMAMQGPRVAVSAADIAGHYAWELAQMLLGRIGTATTGLYTVYYSCDGSTAGTPGDTVDRWTGTYDLAKIPNSPAGTGSHGWMVLTRPITVGITTFNVYVLISSSGFGASCTARTNVSVGLGTPTGGTTTADPTMSLLAFACSFQSNVAGDYGTDFTNPRRYYGNLSSSGDFWFISTVTGELAQSTLFFNPVGTKSNDQCPFFGGHHTAYAGGGAHPMGGPYIFTRGTQASGNASIGLYYNGSTGYPVLDAPPAFALLDASDASIFDKPAYVTVGNSTSPTAIHSRGRLPDVGLSCGITTPGIPSSFRPVNTGTTIKDPDTLLVMYSTVQAMILPYNASIT